MEAAAGRSSYVDPTALDGFEDPGARAIAIWLEALTTVLKA
jgi:hypothetical protein